MKLRNLLQMLGMAPATATAVISPSAQVRAEIEKDIDASSVERKDWSSVGCSDCSFSCEPYISTPDNDLEREYRSNG